MVKLGMTLMTASSGSSADPRRAARVARVAVAAVAALVLAGCSGSSGAGEGGTQTPRVRPDEGMRNTIKTALTQAGRTTEADIVTRGGTRLTTLRTPFLGAWRIVQVDYRQGAHPVMFHVAVGDGRAHLLTGTPEAFGTATTAAGTRVTDAASAVQLGRTYLETTRPPGKLTYVLDSADGIKFRPGITGSAAQKRDQILARYRSVIAAPAVTAEGAGFTVVAYVVQDRALQRRELTIAEQGTVKDKTTTLVPDLPVPYTL